MKTFVDYANACGWGNDTADPKPHQIAVEIDEQIAAMAKELAELRKLVSEEYQKEYEYDLPDKLESGGVREKPSEPAKVETNLTAKEHAEKMFSEWAGKPDMSTGEMQGWFERHLLDYGKFAVRKAADVEEKTPEPKAEQSEVWQVNWVEDYDHENGQYECICCVCGVHFIGHKRRVVCRACSTKEQSEVERLLKRCEELEKNKCDLCAIDRMNGRTTRRELWAKIMELEKRLAESTRPKSYDEAMNIVAANLEKHGWIMLARMMRDNTLGSGDYATRWIWQALVKNNLLATDETVKRMRELEAEVEKLQKQVNLWKQAMYTGQTAKTI